MTNMTHYLIALMPWPADSMHIYMNVFVHVSQGLSAWVLQLDWCSMRCTGCTAMYKRYSTHSAWLAARGDVNFPFSVRSSCQYEMKRFNLDRHWLVHI